MHLRWNVNLLVYIAYPAILSHKISLIIVSIFMNERHAIFFIRSPDKFICYSACLMLRSIRYTWSNIQE